MIYWWRKPFTQIVFSAYLFALYRLGETEDWKTPKTLFPKGRIPFLTIHLAKGLEFPVVVLGNLRKNDNGAEPYRADHPSAAGTHWRTVGSHD